MPFYGGTRKTLLGGGNYTDTVLTTNPIRYWPLNDASGTSATELVVGDNGTYVGPTLGQPGIGDGGTSAFFDGALDYVDIYSAAFNTAFNGQEGTVMAWAKVANAGVWTDGAFRRIFTLQQDATERISAYKTNTNDNIASIYIANNIFRLRDYSENSTNWLLYTLTFSKSNDAAIVYLNTLPAVPLTSLGTSSIVLNPASTIIGSADTTPTQPWYGYLAHVAVWDYALTPAQIAGLYVV